MIDKMLAIIAPHHCCGCGKIGSLLCANCKYDITFDKFGACLACGRLCGSSGVCGLCELAYSAAWCVGSRVDALEKLIDSYKFRNAKRAYVDLAELLDSTLPALPNNVVFIPVPTVSSHIRQRGYDHTLLLCKRLARLRHLPYEQSLGRITNTKQRGASKSLRIQQAKAAFACTGQLDATKTYVLVDDVVTTGATLEYAARALRLAGAKDVWAVAIARQVMESV